ncbi:MAG: two-component system sensor histidine kinase NtrB [Phycisphaerales bacterium]
MSATWLLVGFAAGAIAAALSARVVVRRHLKRVRAAERRARDAERLAEIGAMTGGLAHEIKNPLSTIGLNAQLLAEGVEELPIDSDAKGRLVRRLGTLRREVDRLRGILTDFLQFAGQVRVEPLRSDLNAVVGELADFFLPQAEKMGVRIRSELVPGPLWAMLDVAHVKQATLNLMLNAVQAMAGPASATGGGASDSTRAAGGGELILRTAARTDADGTAMVELHVIDTGPGIEPEARDRIFQPYFTTKSGGTGLGLPTARRLVEAHGGRIELHSEPGRGSDFTMVFPAGND